MMKIPERKMKTEDKITRWIQTTITEAYRLGYKHGLDHGMEMSARLENIHEDDYIIRRDMNAKDLARAIIKEAIPKTVKTDIAKLPHKLYPKLSQAAIRRVNNDTVDYVKNNWRSILCMGNEDNFEFARSQHDSIFPGSGDLAGCVEIDNALTAARDHYFPQKKKIVRRRKKRPAKSGLWNRPVTNQSIKKVVKKSTKRAPKKKKRKVKK